MNDKIFEIPYIGHGKILAKLHNAAPNKASGMKSISSTFLISAMGIMIDEYTHLFNLTNEQSTFPDNWNTGTNNK